MSTYPKIYNLGNKWLGAELLDNEVTIEEKVDGSQFSWGLAVSGELWAKSKRADINFDSPGMFEKATETVIMLGPVLVPGFTYRGEFLQKPRHNKLAYGRVPYENIIGWEIETDEGKFLSWETKQAQFSLMGLETVPLLFCGLVTGREQLDDLLDADSILGGNNKIEGIVIKNYVTPAHDGGLLVGKLVSTAYRESKAVKKPKGSTPEVVNNIIEAYRSEARWQKAVQALSESGQLAGTLRDIGLLIKTVSQDVYEEDGADIAEILFKGMWKTINKGIIDGLAQWYQELLLDEVFREDS